MNALTSVLVFKNFPWIDSNLLNAWIYEKICSLGNESINKEHYYDHIT